MFRNNSSQSFAAKAIVGVIMFGILWTATNAYSSRSFQQSLTQQNFYTVLSSIEERLGNLDAVYAASKHSKGFEEQVQRGFGRLEELEQKIDRLETMLSEQFQKIAENITNHHQHQHQLQRQDSVVTRNNQVVRKIDALCQGVNHKLRALEVKMEEEDRMTKEKLDTLFTKFERMEDTLTTRSEDIEEEIGEVIVSLEELKTKNSSVSDESFIKMKDMDPKLDVIINLVNETAEKCSPLMMVSSLSNPTARPQKSFESETSSELKTLESLINSTRYEQQNSFRNLIVQVGRLEGKNNTLCDLSSDSSQQQQFKNLTHKLDNGFDNVLNMQSLFLDSCQRIQADEPQLEAKIGELLEKMIDVFEKSQSNEDSANLERLMRTHDGSIQRTLHAISYNLEGLLRKERHQGEILPLLHSIKAELNGITKGLANGATNAKNQTMELMLSELRRTASEALSAAAATNKSERIDRVESQVQELFDKIHKVLAATAITFSANTSKILGSIDKNGDDIKIILKDLSDIMHLVENINEKFNSSQSMKTNDIGGFKSVSDTISPTSDSNALDEAIREIFGLGSSNYFNDSSSDASNRETTTTTQSSTIVFQDVDCSNASGLLDVRNRNNNNCSTNFTRCDGSNNNSNIGNCSASLQDPIVFPNETSNINDCSECTEKIIGPQGIDVRDNIAGKKDINLGIEQDPSLLMKLLNSTARNNTRKKSNASDTNGNVKRDE